MLKRMLYFTVNPHDPLPEPEDCETRRNGTLVNLNSDQLHEKLKSAMQREKFLLVWFTRGSNSLQDKQWCLLGICLLFVFPPFS